MNLIGEIKISFIHQYIILKSIKSYKNYCIIK